MSERGAAAAEPRGTHPLAGRRVHGLTLALDFDLPGIDGTRLVAPAAADLKIHGTSREHICSAWSGRGGRMPWSGRQGDGADLAIEWGRDGEILFRYGESAIFLLHRDLACLDCHANDAGPGWQRVLIGKIVPAIAVMRGFEALHAAALDTGGAGVVAIMAPSGGGKSTLTAALIGRGWSLFADDQLTLSRTDGRVLAHPGSAHMSIAESHPPSISPSALGESLGTIAGEQWLSVRDTCEGARPVRMLCLLERAPGLMLDSELLRPSPLPLSPYVLGLEDDEQRLRERFLLYADLTADARIVRLTAGPEHSPHELARLVEAALRNASEVSS